MKFDAAVDGVGNSDAGRLVLHGMKVDEEQFLASSGSSLTFMILPVISFCRRAMDNIKKTK